MKLITGFTCLVAAAKAFEAGEYIISRVESTMADIYTPLENDGYDIHIGKYVHMRREGNSIVNDFHWGFEDTELDWSKETISWTDSSINYKKTSKITVDRYPFFKSFYPEDTTIFNDELTIKASFDETSADVSVTHAFTKDDDTATVSVNLSASLDELTKQKVSMSISGNGNVNAGSWTEENLAKIGLNFDSFNGQATLDVGTKCNRGVFKRGCFVSVTGTGGLNGIDDFPTVEAAYKVVRGGVFVFAAALGDESHTIKIFGSDKTSFMDSERFTIKHSVNKQKGNLIINAPTPWGFYDECGELINNHAEPFDTLFEFLEEYWLLGFIFSDKIAASMPKDLFDLSDVATCANIRSPPMLDLFNNNVRPVVNSMMKGYYQHFDMEPMSEKDTMVEAQCTMWSGANDFLQRLIVVYTDILADYRQSVNDITGAKGEEMFNAVWLA